MFARLDRRSAASLRAKLDAAIVLDSLTGAESTLPPWRILAPPPPAVLMQHYRAAQRATGVPWYYLAAIHLVETRMGRIRGTSSAGAQGPMQFIPGTWDMYGAGGDVDDPQDAIMAAGRLLEANGAPARIGEALYRYNQSDDYVLAVRRYGEHMRSDPAAYRGYYHWQVTYRHSRGLMVLPVGYPKVRPRPAG